MSSELSRQERERQGREQAIVEAAEQVFLERGFEDASMDEISERAEFTKRTVYQYFGSKQDLYFAVVLKGFGAMMAYMDADTRTAPDGLGKVRSALERLYGFYRDEPELFSLVSGWSQKMRREDAAGPAVAAIQSVSNRLFLGLASALREGVADGSVRHDLAVEPAVYGLAFMAIGFLSQLASTGATFTRYIGQEEGIFVASSFDLVLDGLAAKGAGDGAH